MEPKNDIKYEKKKQLFLDQKKTLDSFLKTGAISRLMICLWKNHNIFWYGD